MSKVKVVRSLVLTFAGLLRQVFHYTGAKKPWSLRLEDIVHTISNLSSPDAGRNMDDSSLPCPECALVWYDYFQKLVARVPSDLAIELLALADEAASGKR